ncbi:MAG: thiamine diphosphokinase [Neisseriaceae bacterium]
MIDDILGSIYPLKDFNLILADGRFPQHIYLKSLLKTANNLIACDGSANRLLKHNIIPNHIIGDCDSISYKLYKQFKNIITKDDDQSTNDLTKAVNLAHSLKLDNIVILGATGMREDHAIANIGLLIKYNTIINKIAMISDYGIFTVSNKNPISTIKGQQISLFSPIPNTKITCSELKWPLSNYQFNSWNSGTLNEATGNYIIISSNNPIIVYRSF